MSNSTTQSYSQHRFLVMATACFAVLAGRYPYESAWNIGSRIGSMACLTTVCAMRSVMVGIPSFLVPPFALGISTCFTGGGKYVPDDIRFHSLYRFAGRFCSNISIVSSSMPAAPRLALTCWYASHTARFAIANGFVDVLTLIPVFGLVSFVNRITLPLRSTLITRDSSLLRAAPPLVLASVFFLMVSAICHFPFHPERSSHVPYQSLY